MAAPQRLQQGVRDRVCPAAGAPWPRRQGVPCDSALEGAQQALHSRVRGLRRDPDAGDASEAGQPDPRREERTRWMWFKNRVDWTEKETNKWESVALERCVTVTAYEMRLVLQCIYEMEGRREG